MREKSNWMYEEDEQDGQLTFDWTKSQEKQTPGSLDDEYMFFQPELLREGVKITKQMEAAAEKLIREQKIRLKEVTFRYTQEKLVAIAYGEVLLQEPHLVVLTFDKDRIRSAYCQVPGCYIGFEWSLEYEYGDEIGCGYQRRICMHEAALLFLVQDYLRVNRPGDATDFFGYTMMQSFRNMRRGGAIQQSQQMKPQRFRLEPRLERRYGILNLSFRLGVEKMMVVKNLSQLVTAVESKASMKFGSKTIYSFAGCEWEEKSQQYYRFIRSCVRQEQERSEYFEWYENGYDTGMAIKAVIPLFGSRLDEFYTMCEGLSLEYTDKRDEGSGKQKVILKEQDPSIELLIQKYVDENEIFHGILVEGNMPEIFHGVECHYYFEDAMFLRMSKEISTQLGPLIHLRMGEQVQFQVGRRNLSEFFYRILPQLQRYTKIRWKDREMIESYLPPEVVFQFYLDYEDHMIVCRTIAVYGETSIAITDPSHDGRVKLSFRESAREEEAVSMVRKYMPEVNISKECFFTKKEEEIYQLLEFGIHDLMEAGEVHLTDQVRALMRESKPRIKVGISVESQLMNLSVGSEDMSREELLELLAAYRKKKKYYRFKNGQFLSLGDKEYEEIALMLEALHISKKEFLENKIHVPAYRALYLDQMLEKNDQLYAKRDHYFKKLIKDFKTIRDSEYEVPEQLRDILRNYQIYGFRWLKTLEQYGFGGILADDMGLGKTLQVITLLLAAKEEDKLQTALITAPASLVYNWKEEFLKFAPEITVCVLSGSQKERADILSQWQQWDVIITSYDLLKRDISHYEGKQFQYQIIDEAQYIKNHGTAAAKAIKVINSNVRVALTGTPIENRLSELWSIFDYLMPGFLYGYETFRSDMEVPIVKNNDEDAMQKLKRMVSPFILRRLKTDVLQELPDKLEEVHYVKLEQQQQKLYDAQVTHMLSMLREQSSENYQKNKLKLLAEITKIRQICCDPSLLWEDYCEGSAKCEACMELIEKAVEGGHKLLIFSQFTSMLEILEIRLVKDKITYYKITGATPKEKRLEFVNKFNGNDVPVFLISLRAGGTGLNLIGADVVIHYDPWWNVAAQNQATDRAHRIGQKKTVSVFKLIVKDSIEEKILHLQETKQNLADEILNSESGSLMSMSKEELMNLLES